MAEAALARDHKITLLHRTRTIEPAFADVEHLFLDRNGDLSSLSGRSFDATIDVCAYVPSQVKHLAAALGGRPSASANTDRWVRRIARGGEVLAPGPRDAPIQAVDARDQGEWTIRLVEDGTVGTFNSVTPTPPFGFGDLLNATVSAVGPRRTTLTWVDATWLRERGESYQSLPLWTGRDDGVDPCGRSDEGLLGWPVAATAD
jgi:hypothetical protein